VKGAASPRLPAATGPVAGSPVVASPVVASPVVASTVVLSTVVAAGTALGAYRALRRYPHAAVFVAEAEDGRVIGRLSISRDQHPASRHVADLGLMVDAEYRRRGIGRALLDAAVEWAREAEVRKLELHVFPWNEAAIALYEDFGFIREGHRKNHYYRGEEYVDAILMAYELPA